MISFTAIGTPAPKGSTKAFYRPGMRFPVVTEDNKHTRPWASEVKGSALETIRTLGIFGIVYPDAPIDLKIIFYMPRPKSLPKRVLFHTKKPDLDKLVRAVKDALTGVLWSDDSQVMEIRARKVYAAEGDHPGARKTVGKCENVEAA